MKFKAIIFDLDGTIIDSNSAWKDSVKTILENRKIILTPEAEQNMHAQIEGLELKTATQVVKKVADIDDSIECLVEETLTHVKNNYDKNLKFIDGFLNFHAFVEQLKLPKGIATNADQTTLAIAKQKMELSKLFGQHIYSIADVNNVYKPNPDVYLYAANQLKVDPSECIAIEDSAHGVTAAKAAGMYCIGINTNKSPQHIRHSDRIIDAYQDLCLLTLLDIKPSQPPLK